MLACCGVRPPLRELQWKHAATTFSQWSRPPCDSGMTWSRVRCWRWNSRPQYRHRCWSRANSAWLVSAGVGSSACGRACPRAAMIGCSSIRLRSPVTRLVPPCTVRQGSPRVHATAPRAYRQVASCQLIQSSTRPCASSESRRTASRRAGMAFGKARGEASRAGSASEPACSRRNFALSGSIGTRVYTPRVTVWVAPQASNAAASSAISGAAPDSIAALCCSVRGSRRAK